MENPSIPFQKVLINLFQGVVYQDLQADSWLNLLNFQAQIQDYVSVLGLQLIVDESEGYAYLRQKIFEENEEQAVLPKLIQRRPLSFTLSLLLVLLRKKLLEQDASAEELRLILTEEQILQMMQLYFPAGNNEVKGVGQIQTALNKAIEIGVLRRLTTDEKRFEVKRVIKALIDADWLTQMNEKLKEYSEYAKREV